MEAKMEALLKVIAQSLVDSPDEVNVTKREEDDKIILELSVAPDEMGKVIGKQGRIAKAIRTVIKGATVRSDKKVFVDIV